MINGNVSHCHPCCQNERCGLVLAMSALHYPDTLNNMKAPKKLIAKPNRKDCSVLQSVVFAYVEGSMIENHVPLQLGHWKN